ncbi:MAG: hypothetical protein SGPRY_013717 [Prymnesium sp.]
MAKSSAKVYSYVSLFANTHWMRLRFKCFACNETHLEWFRRETDKIALGFGGSCDENILDSQGGHPKQFVNYLAVEPGTLQLKPHYWPGENGGIFQGSATAGAYYVYSYEVNMNMLDELFALIYTSPAQDQGDFVQQFYMYSLESDAYAPQDQVGSAYNGHDAKWVLHFKMNGGTWSTDQMKAHSTAISSTIGRHLPCRGYYNYIESTMPCAKSDEQLLAAYLSDPNRAKDIKASWDPNGVFRNPLLHRVNPGITSSCEKAYGNDANGVSCGVRIQWLIDNQALSQASLLTSRPSESQESASAD